MNCHETGKLERTYKAVVEFIQWYNENKEEKKKYPFNEGDDYWTIEDGEVVWSCWDDVSEELYDETPDKKYYSTEEDATKALNKSN
jgi:hypothetical protein